MPLRLEVHKASKLRVFPDKAKSQNVRRVVLIPISVILVLCLVEFPAFIGVINYERIIGPASGDVFLATNKGDAELLHIHPPHSHFSGAARGGNISANFRIPRSDMTLYRWDIRYDQNGFRNDRNLESADVAVVGDSFVEDTVIPTAQLATSVLANLQGKVVANLGQYGYGPLEELAVLRRYALPLRPHTVIWMFSESSDLKDVIHFRKVTTATHVSPSIWSAFWAHSFTRNALAQLHVWFKRTFEPSGVRRSAIVHTPNGETIKTYFLYASAPLSKEDVSAFDETTRTIKAAHALCAGQGTNLMFVFIPTKFRVLRGFCQFPRESECRNWTVNDLPERLERAVRSISPDIGYLDVTPYLAGAVSKGVVPYYPDDDHWSPEGQRIAAEAVNSYLLESGRR